MKYFTLFIILLAINSICFSQDIDITLSAPESGSKTHQARNSITFAPNYSYTPNGGTMTAEIVNPIVSGNVSYNYTVVDPETRSLNTSYLVGAKRGAFNVNSLGAANYSIPIDVPPGKGELQPNIAITYNNLTGSGIAGYGWNITGLSAITRSPKTYFHDGESSGVDLTSTDRFTLDGQRLVCISGTYGQNNSSYKTEHDVFSLIQCYANTNTPYQFKVQTKTGLTYQYGYTDDADQTATGTNQIISWYVNKITDVYGNHIDFTYLKNKGNIYISDIAYGNNTIMFYYKERSDKTIAYLKGIKFEQNLLLDRIEIKYNDNIIKKYVFKYNYPYSNYSRYSILNEVIEYGLNNSRLNSTAFTYQTPDNVTFSQTIYDNTHNYISYKSKLTFGDFNGDGRKDVFCVDNPDVSGSYSGWKIFTSDGDDTFTLTGSGDFLFNNSRTVYNTTDLNGDGMDDLLIILYKGEHYDIHYIKYRCYDFYYALHSGNSFELSPRLAHVEYPVFNVFGGKLSDFETKPTIEKIGMDFDGDGLNDYYIRTPNGGYKIYGFTYTNGNLSTSMSLKYSGSISYGDFFTFTDFNGDGKVEIMAIDANGYKVYELQGSTLVQTRSSSSIKKDHHLRFGDFNGDGKTDIFMYGYKNYDWSNWQIRLSTGTGFETNYIYRKKSNLKDDLVRTGDFNGDGCTDIMAMADDDNYGNHYYYITKNRATDFYSYNYSGQYHSHNYFIEDLDGDGRDEYLVTDGKSPWWNGYMIYDSGTKNRYLLNKIGNGLGHLTKISYTSIAQKDAPYTKGTGAVFPVFDFQGALPVVTSVLSDNGIGSQNTTNYAYEGLKIHRQGKGILCMSKQSVTDVASNMITDTYYQYNTTNFNPELINSFIFSGQAILSSTHNDWAYNSTATGVIFPYISSSTQSNNLTGHSVTTSYTYNNYGNPLTIVKEFNDGSKETTTNVYNNGWIISKITGSTTNYEKDGETISKTVTYTYDSEGIIKPDKIKYYEGTDKYFFKDNDYDSNGNLIKLTVGGSGVNNRITEYTYSSDGVNVKTVKDPLQHTTEYFYDTYGRLTSEKDFLNNTTSYTYDNLGRTLSVTKPDGFVTNTSYNWGLTGGPANATYFIQQTGNDGSLSKVWYDNLSREIRSDVKGFNGSYIYTATEYNGKGQLYRISEPSTSATLSQWNTHTYDSYGRITGITRPSGRNTTYTYSVNRITETTAGKTSWKETDSRGLITTAHDNGGDISYTYYPDGQPKTITAPGNIVTSMEYDVAGNQTKITDPSAGTIVYSYDAYGQLKTQTNAKGQTTTFAYYADGRINTKSAPEGTTTYTYNGNKQLTGISSPGNVTSTYGYDGLGRVNSISETIDGSTFSTTFTFDDKGRLKTRTHPSGIVETNNYNGNGYLASVKAGNSMVWNVTAMNARGQVTAAQYGSSLLADFGYDDYGLPVHTNVRVGPYSLQVYRYSFNAATGNLNWRKNQLKNLNETFTYDILDRMKTVTGPENLTMTYAGNGNILTKSDVSPDNFTYGNNASPYALTGLSNTRGVIPPATQTATYTSFEQVSTIDQNDYHATFSYNSDNQRCKMEIEENSNNILTRWYIGSRYIKETAAGTTKEYTWLSGDAYTAPAVAVKQGSSIQYFYLLRDYLGNITHVVDAASNVVAEYNYDTWGRRRDKDNWSYTLDNEPDLFAGRGFTGHEYLPWFMIYNMNGRLYDPVVGRFLSPDNNVQMPDFTQNFNRYSYALNNPLKFTDPDGEIVWAPIIAFAIWNGALNVAMNRDNINSFGEGLGYFGIGAGTAILGGVAGQAAAAATSFASGALMGGAGAFGSYFISIGGNALLNGSVFSIKASLIASGIGTFAGGLAGAANAYISNLDDLNLLAYEYTVDVKTGAINQVSNLGGANIHFYHLGFATDGGSAFRYFMTQVVEGANTINSFRFWQSAASTISAFSVPAAALTGYFLEPAGPSTSTRNLDRRIPSGSYNLTPNLNSYPNNYMIYNQNVPASRGITIHSGNHPNNTSGCLLPGVSWGNAPGKYSHWGNNWVGGSGKKLDQLNLMINKAGYRNVRVNIFDNY